MPDHNEAMRLADEVRVVADRLQYTPGGFYGVETVGPINQAAALLRQLSAERDQLRAEVERLRKDGERMGCPPEGYQLVPHEPTHALLRPFYNCPPDELQHAWSAALRVARVAMYRQREAEEHARAIEAAKEA